MARNQTVGMFMSESKKHILETAFRLFLQKNFKEVTMNEIVEKTGLSKGAFYHYFKSKEELFEDVVNEYYLSDLAVQYEKLDKSSLSKYCEEYLNMVKSFSAWQLLGEGNNEELTTNYYLLIFDALKILPGFKQKMIKMNQNEFNAMKQAVINARKNGEIKSILSDDQIAGIFLFITDGLGIRSIMYGNLSTMLDQIKKFWDSFYASIKS